MTHERGVASLGLSQVRVQAGWQALDELSQFGRVFHKLPRLTIPQVILPLLPQVDSDLEADQLFLGQLRESDAPSPAKKQESMLILAES